MNANRRSPASARRLAEAKLLEEEAATPPSADKPLIDSATTGGTACPYDEPDAEETLP